MEALEWVEERSASRNSDYAVMKVLGREAVGCVARVKVETLLRSTRISVRQLYRSLAVLEELREIEKVAEVKDTAGVRVRHLRKFCLCQLVPTNLAVCPRKQRGVPDLRSVAQGLAEVDAEGCCLCRGSGWKLVPRGDGLAGNVAVRCRRHVKQLELLEAPKVSWAPVITPAEMEWRSERMKGLRREYVAPFRLTA